MSDLLLFWIRPRSLDDGIDMARSVTGSFPLSKETHDSLNGKEWNRCRSQTEQGQNAREGGRKQDL